ncbi:hypothetical protein ACIRQQ_32430 [Streptomyces fuscichromogenes]|uniref:hypothetical protein n=1 Tax=Streptomyces fuscichromogenes TaxID=1324013 RepID=UPI003819F640
MSPDHHQGRLLRIATDVAPLPGVQDALLYVLPIRVVRTGRELEQRALHSQYVVSAVRFARHVELELPGLVGQSIAEAELGFGGAVQQAVCAAAVRSGMDLTLFVLPQRAVMTTPMRRPRSRFGLQYPYEEASRIDDLRLPFPILLGRTRAVRVTGVGSVPGADGKCGLPATQRRSPAHLDQRTVCCLLGTSCGG